MAGSRFTVSTIFTGKDLISPKVRRIGANINKMAKRSKTNLRGVDRAMGKMAGKFTSSARTMAIAGGIAAGAFWKVTEGSREFGTSISRVAASMGTTVDKIGAVRKEAIRLGGATSFTAAQAADGFNELAKSGFTVEQQLAAVPSVLAAAAAGEIEMSEAAMIAVRNINAFGLAAGDTGMIMDTLAVVSTKTATTIPSLQQSLQNVAPVAKEFGITFKQSAKMVALMQDAGIDASEAGSSIKTMFNKLVTPSKAAAKAMEEAGVSFVDSHNNMLPPDQVFQQLGELGKSFEGNAGKVAGFSELMGLRGQKAGLLLSRLFDSAKGQQLDKALENVTDAAKKMAATKLDNVAGDVVKMSSAWDGLIISMSETNDGPLRELFQQITKFIQSPEAKALMQDFGKGAGNFFTWLSKSENQESMKFWAGALFRFAKAFLTIQIALKAATLAQAAYNLVVLANPYVAAAVALVALGALLYTFWPEVSAFIAGVFEWIGSAWTYVWNGIKSVLSTVLGGMKTLLSAHIQFMIDKIRDLLALISKIPGVGKLAEGALSFMDEKGLDRSDSEGITGMVVKAMGANAGPQGVDLTVRADPGTSARVDNATHPLRLSIPNTAGF